MPRTDALALDQQLCFALYSASRAVTRLYRPLLEALGLTYPQYLVMLVLWERGTVTVKELGKALDLDSGTLSPLLKRLEANGVVARVRSAADERSVLIAPTEAGAALREQAATVPERIACASGMDPRDLIGFRDQLKEMTRIVNETEVDP
ncbi:MarR family winged helix-turn-helix transcriptional regulator [Nocardia sp. NPDC057227]|uniref:MarR family winged helix-turn-helix transcriptional regulator n=1 Tax=Nocardia sp. NPDC057227 TaxID=3346056 RepID=UPI003637A692